MKFAGFNLYDLYRKLPQQVQNRITELWDQDIWRQHTRTFLNIVQEQVVKEKIPRHFSALLKFGANTFIDLRYVYEKPRNINNLIVELPSILRRVIVEIHPKWDTRK
jgi:hypothetical protein